MYDLLLVGAGLYAGVIADRAKKDGKKVLVIERRDHIAGNMYTEKREGINVHVYGPHIFHTADKKVWEYINGFAEFNRFTNTPVARYKDEIYNLPFNMNTFSRMWGVKTPEEARKKIEEQRREMSGKEPSNLEEQAISLVGRDIYEKLIKGYTEKQWGHDCRELPAFIIKRLPVRFVYDNNYFNDPFQGIPSGGYTQIAEKMFEGLELKTGTDYFSDRKSFDNIAERIVFTGMIDEFFDHRFGELEYRSLRFESEILDTDNYQGSAIVNYTEREIPYTRIIEHKHFEFGCAQGSEINPKTVITREYPLTWKAGDEPYYPMNDEKNNGLYKKYTELAAKERPEVFFGGRLGKYKYLDMDKVIAEALADAKSLGLD